MFGFHKASLKLHGRRKFIILCCQQHINQAEILDLFHPREILVHLVNGLADQVLYFPCRTKRGVVREGHASILGEFLYVLLVDHHQTSQEHALIPDHHDIRDIRRELQFVLDFCRRDVLATCRDDDVLEASGDFQETLIVQHAHVARAQPSIFRKCLSRLFRVFQVALKDVARLVLDFAILRDAQLRTRQSRTYSADLVVF